MLLLLFAPTPYLITNLIHMHYFFVVTTEPPFVQIHLFSCRIGIDSVIIDKCSYPVYSPYFFSV